MSILQDSTRAVIDWIYALKDQHLHWQLSRQPQRMQLKQDQVLAEHTLSAELKKRNAQLKHELALLKQQHDAELFMHKTKCKQDIKDYQHYLSALDQLKMSIQSHYAHLPSALTFTIHHHAKQLLNALWEAQTPEEKVECELRLIHFMTAVHDDACLRLEHSDRPNMPEKTLALLQVSPLPCDDQSN